MEKYMVHCGREFFVLVWRKYNNATCRFPRTRWEKATSRRCLSTTLLGVYCLTMRRGLRAASRSRGDGPERRRLLASAQSQACATQKGSIKSYQGKIEPR